MLLPGIIAMIIGFIVYDEIKKRNRIKRAHVYRMQTGGYRMSNTQDHIKDSHEFLHEFITKQDYTHYPQEYVPYLNMNSDALRKYTHGLTNLKQIEKGNRPIDYPLRYYDSTYWAYDPFSEFNKLGYPEKIKKYNETGVFEA